MSNYNIFVTKKIYELIDNVLNVIIVAIITAIYTNGIPSFHIFCILHEIVYFLFSINFLIIIYFLYKIQRNNYFSKEYISIIENNSFKERKYTVFSLISIIPYFFLYYILTIDYTKGSLYYIITKHSFINSIFLYFIINTFIVFLLCFFDYTNKIHKYNLGISYNSNPTFIYVEEYHFSNSILLYILFLFILPLLLYFLLKNYYIVANNMVITPFILFSTFTILFTVFIPIIKKMPDTSPESSMDELEKSYF